MKPVFQRIVSLIALAAFCATLSVRAVDTRHALGADEDINASLRADGQLASELLVQEVAQPERGDFDEHCALCHWARTFSNTIATEPARDAAPYAIGDAIVRVSFSIRSAERIAGPPRGPPSLA